ncbi:MAG TPA: aminotransferase class V-fold PLP-dependent enzyme [Thermoanaerobaculia bacterium]|nr:aminotransferase class V-fold PLP-dependent enzyme [Thermoanaerobaculia bacterium]
MAAAAAARAEPPVELAGDEAFWSQVQRAFRVDRSLINLNNGGVSPAPVAVEEALRRYLEYSNLAPAHNMWRVLEPQRETVRRDLAELFGCDAEEIALTRNASEALEICQLGFDLRPGDEVLATDQDYGRMLDTFRQRERRDGVVLKLFPLPVPLDDPGVVVDLYRRQLTPRTRLILVSHMVNLTGQVLPARAVVRLGRERGVPVIVDGAHSFAHFPFAHADLECDYYATSLHKWLFAPVGAGMLYVRRERVRPLWPLMPAPAKLDDDIRKFEEIGTHPAANFLALGEAVAFHRGLGAERKAARLIHLRDRWAARLGRHPRLRLLTSLATGHAVGIATFAASGMDHAALVDHLWERWRILVTHILHPSFEGIRVTPSVYTTLEEIDRFCAAVEDALERGIPAPAKAG